MTESTFDITSTGFDDPFFTGSASASTGSDDRSLPVSIAGRGFLLDLKSNQFSRRSLELLNTQQAETGGDDASVAPDVWRRVVESWHQGAGQARYDRPQDSLSARFNSSAGIDPWTKYRLGLLPSTEELLALGAGEVALLESIGPKLFVILETEVQRYDDPTASGTHTDEAIANPPIAATTDGENLYVLDDTGVIHRYDSVANTWNHAWATVATFDPTKAMLAYVKGYILVGNGPVLIDYTNPAVPVTIDTHRLDGWHWKAASEGLSVIYILGGMGDRWFVHRVGIQSTAAALDAPIVAASLPEGEFAYTIATYLGYVLIGVHSGWRFALPDSSGQLTYGQVIRTPKPVRCFECQDRFVWFGLSLASGDLTDLDALEGAVYGEHAGLGRADLSTFVAPSTPASASDLSSATLFGNVMDVATVGGENDGLGTRVFSLTGTVTGSVLIQRTAKVASGWLRQGAMTFNSTDLKMGLYAQVHHDALRGSIELEVAVDGSDTFVEIGANGAADSTSMGNVAYTAPFRALELKYVLTRDTGDTSLAAIVRRSEMRAVNIPGRATEWRIPVFCHESLNYEGRTVTRDVADDFDFLVSLVETREQFTYREGDRTWLLHATDFLWTPFGPTTDGSTFEGTFTLIAREIT